MKWVPPLHLFQIYLGESANYVNTLYTVKEHNEER